MSDKQRFVFKKVKTEYAMPASGSCGRGGGGGDKRKYKTWIKELNCSDSILLRTLDGQLKFFCKFCSVRISTSHKRLRNHVESEKHAKNLPKPGDPPKPKIKKILHPQSTSSSVKAKPTAKVPIMASSTKKIELASTSTAIPNQKPAISKTVDLFKLKVDLIETMFSTGMPVEKLQHNSKWEIFFDKYCSASADSNPSMKTTVETICEQQLTEIGDRLRALRFWAYIGEIYYGEDVKPLTFIILGITGTRQSYLLACKSIERKPRSVFEEFKFILDFYVTSSEMETRLHQVYLVDAMLPYRPDLSVLIQAYYQPPQPVAQPSEEMYACKNKLAAILTRIRVNQQILPPTAPHSNTYVEKILICEYKMSHGNQPYFSPSNA